MAQKLKPDYVLMGSLGILLFFGLIALASASSVVGFERFNDAYFFLKRQVLFGVLPGLAAFFIMSRINYGLWRKLAPWLLPISIILLLVVFIPGVGLKLGGSRSWISLLGYSFQPSELVKLSFIIYLAAWLERRLDVLTDWRQGLLPFAIVLAMVVVPIILQPDIGTVSIFIAVSVIMFFASGAPIKHLLILAGAGLAGFYALIKVAPYRVARLTIYLNPELDPQGIGYHLNQALLAVGSGGLFGLGLGHSRQKFAYLPEAAGDSIFAITAEELGFFLSLAFISLFALIIWRMIKIADHAPDRFARYVSIGVATWLGIQALLNIGAMVGVFPLTGLPLPFVSQGGTALLAALTASGILLNISKHASQRSAPKQSRLIRKRLTK